MSNFLLFFRMTAGNGGDRTTGMGRIGSTVKSEATLFLLLLLSNPSFPRQVGLKTVIGVAITINFLGPSLFSKCWVRLPQSLGLCCTWSRLSSYGDHDDDDDQDHDDHDDGDEDYDACNGSDGGVMVMITWYWCANSKNSKFACDICTAWTQWWWYRSR